MIRIKLAMASLVAGCSLGAMTSAASAQEAQTTVQSTQERNYQIPAQPLQEALTAFAEASGSDLLYPSEIVENKRSSAVNGTFTAQQALTRLLAGTDINANQVSENVFSLQGRYTMRFDGAATSTVSGIVRSTATGTPLPGAMCGSPAQAKVRPRMIAAFSAFRMFQRLHRSWRWYI